MEFKIIFFNNEILILIFFKIKTPLHLAVEREYIKIIKLLLENKDIDISIKDNHDKKPIDYTTNNEIKFLLSH